MFPIFNKLGGSDQVIRLLRKYGRRKSWPSHHTVDMWRRKGVLPGLVMRDLMVICADMGVRYKTADFYLDGDIPLKPPPRKRRVTA